MKLADAIEANAAQIAAVESIDNGKPHWIAQHVDIVRAPFLH